MADQLPTIEGDAGPREVIPVIGVNAAGQVVGFGSKGQYVLLTNQAAIGNGPSAGPVSGGDYIWRVTATNWNGATATLQFLDLDGTTWSNVKKADGTTDVTLTANGSVPIGIAQGSVLRVAVTAAAPTAMNSQIAGL
ncbi:hypothetical protein EPK99_06480 [Neorhizobium lilium]|uniref:Uncharacterized protein n=1 Tax=Neorhizobium lilium TaxID=2503024 RepID=A0A444LH35_9HYPH|nr:hypothetical protein [Neorhizobium lilium]RWX78275.1 hypothetical protein EPK99_06480 [Neorhizobium lilium]